MYRILLKTMKAQLLSYIEVPLIFKRHYIFHN